MRDDIPPVVALCGVKGSGKSYCAKYLSEKYGYQVIKFASPIKDMLRALGLTNDQLEGNMKEASTSLLCGHSARWAMQSLGTEWGRKCIDENFWVNLWVRKAERSLGLGLPVVVDDLRFSNEAQAVRDLDGLILQVLKEGENFDGHQSEVIDFESDLQFASDNMVKPVLDNCLRLWKTAKEY